MHYLNLKSLAGRKAQYEALSKGLPLAGVTISPSHRRLMANKFGGPPELVRLALKQDLLFSAWCEDQLGEAATADLIKLLTSSPSQLTRHFVFYDFTRQEAAAAVSNLVHTGNWPPRELSTLNTPLPVGDTYITDMQRLQIRALIAAVRGA